MVGLGFPDRNDSFDFKAALDDFRKQYQIEKGIYKPTVKTSDKDFSLKEGEKITLNIPGLTSNTNT